MMRTDLATARATWIAEAHESRERSERERSDFLTYEDEDGMFADFHSHRHTFISNLGKAGVPLTVAQKLARHCDPKLTANTYTHLEVADRAAAIKLLPGLHTKEPAPTGGVLRAMGTDDAQATTTYGDKKGQHLGQQSGGKSCKTWRLAAKG